MKSNQCALFTDQIQELDMIINVTHKRGRIVCHIACFSKQEHVGFNARKIARIIFGINIAHH